MQSGKLLFLIFFEGMKPPTPIDRMPVFPEVIFYMPRAAASALRAWDSPWTRRISLGGAGIEFTHFHGDL